MNQCLFFPANYFLVSLKLTLNFISHNIFFTKLLEVTLTSHCFSDGIPHLVRLLAHENPNVQVNACGALRNLCFGPQNNENKIAVRNCEGVPALVRLVRESKDPDVKEQATGG